MKKTIDIYQLTQKDIRSPLLQEGRRIFLSYFIDIYKDVSPSQIGLDEDLSTYLEKIFASTQKELLENSNLKSFVAYDTHQIVGFSTANMLSDKQLLIRTLPVDVRYRERELEIRDAFFSHFHSIFSSAECFIMMVRRSNGLQTRYCIEQNFESDESLFNVSYIDKTYDKKHYVAFSYQISKTIIASQ
jgi:hypothetical protein